MKCAYLGSHCLLFNQDLPLKHAGPLEAARLPFAKISVSFLLKLVKQNMNYLSSSVYGVVPGHQGRPGESFSLTFQFCSLETQLKFTVSNEC